MIEEMNKKMYELFLKVKDLCFFCNTTCDIFERYSSEVDTDTLAECLDMLYDIAAVLGDFLADFKEFFK